ncbi:MAG: metal ABC transporter substrate-binding protein [Verrucomicrobiota bacterium]
MKYHITVLLTVIAACTGSAWAKLNVVTTLADYAAIAREIGGDHVEITSMAKPTEDPHFVDARPSFVVKLRAADILIEGGAELEVGWLPPLLQTARNSKLETGAVGRVQASEGIRLLDVPATLSRAAGDVHASGNPHFMIDPIIAKAVAAHIARAFAAADPANAAVYVTNEKKFETTIDAKLQEWGKALLPFRGQHLAAYHDDWLYFARRFGFEVDVFLEPRPGVPPSPKHLAEVIGQIKAAHIKAILVEPFHNRKIAEKVASSTGAHVVDGAQYPEALPNTATYVQLIDVMVSRLTTALKN